MRQTIFTLPRSLIGRNVLRDYQYNSIIFGEKSDE